MKPTAPQTTPPADAEQRKSVEPVVCYPIDTLPPYDPAYFEKARENLKPVNSITIAPRDAETFEVSAGQFFRIYCPEGPQVGDLNLWNQHNLEERFFSGKTRALHGTHVSTGDRLWRPAPFSGDGNDHA